MPARCNIGVSENAIEHFARTTIFTACGHYPFSFSPVYPQNHFTSPSFYVMFIYDCAILYGYFLSEKRTIRQNIYFEGVVNRNVRDLF